MIAVACVLRETSRYGLDTIRQLLQAEGTCSRARNSYEPEALHTHFPFPGFGQIVKAGTGYR
jgi:hypothetical protein